MTKCGIGTGCKGNRHTILCPKYGGLINPPTPYHTLNKKTKKWELEDD